MKATTIRIEDKYVDYLSNIYGAKVTGAQICVSGFIEIQKRTLLELKGKFNNNELSAIVDNLNGTMRQNEFMANVEMFWNHLEDGNSFENLFSKWEIDEQNFKEKVMSLTSAQVYFIQDAVFRFWDSGKDLEFFLAGL